MRIQNQNSRLTEALGFEAQLILTLKKIQKTMHVDDAKFSSYLGVTPSQYEKIKKRKVKLPLNHLVHFCQNIHLDLDLLYFNKIDFKVLQSQFLHSKPTLPERYLDPEKSFSRFRSVGISYQALNHCYGKEFTKKVFSKLQVHEGALLNAHESNDFISPHLSEDLFLELRHRKYKDDQFFKIGQVGVALTRDSSPVVKAFSDCQNGFDFFRTMHEEKIHLFDHLWSYKMLVLSENSCTIEVKIPKNTKELFGAHSVGSREICLARQGVYCGLLNTIPNVRHSHVEEKSCVYLGDPSCVFTVVWENESDLSSLNKNRFSKVTKLQ